MAGAGARTAGGFNPALPGLGHRMLAKALGASMWFFIFYRARKDGPALLGYHHFEGHGGDEGHGEHHRGACSLDRD